MRNRTSGILDRRAGNPVIRSAFLGAALLGGTVMGCAGTQTPAGARAVDVRRAAPGQVARPPVRFSATFWTETPKTTLTSFVPVKMEGSGPVERLCDPFRAGQKNTFYGKIWNRVKQFGVYETEESRKACRTEIHMRTESPGDLVAGDELFFRAESQLCRVTITKADAEEARGIATPVSQKEEAKLKSLGK